MSICSNLRLVLVCGTGKVVEYVLNETNHAAIGTAYVLRRRSCWLFVARAHVFRSLFGIGCLPLEGWQRVVCGKGLAKLGSLCLTRCGRACVMLAVACGVVLVDVI